VRALKRRLQKLEGPVDASGFVPHSQKWHEYWHEKIRAYTSDDYQGPRPPHPLFPLEAFQEYIRNAPDEDYRYDQALEW
jgi:hypothetical protein